MPGLQAQAAQLKHSDRAPWIRGTTVQASTPFMSIPVDVGVHWQVRARAPVALRAHRGRRPLGARVFKLPPCKRIELTTTLPADVQLQVV